MNIILDTNTLVAGGFNPKSSSAKILNAVDHGTVHLVWNAATRREARRMITQIPRLSWPPVAGLFRDEDEYHGQLDMDQYHFIEDPEDRKFAALGEATKSIIITNDRHLLTHEERLKTPIMTPHAFTERYATLVDEPGTTD